MSFILDALKKSEMERQQQSVPGLMDARIVNRRSRLPVWGVALGLLLAVNLVVLTLVLVRRGASDVPAPRPAAVPAREVAAPASRPFSPMDAAPEYAPEIPVAPAEVAAPAEGVASANSAAAPDTTPAASPAPATHAPAHGANRADPLLSDAQANEENTEVLPSINELSLTGAQALPELHLDVHVYSTKPAERFVYINMRKYHEGGRLAEGPLVESIRRDGVVLNYQGLRFLLPRQS
jgi:general secretion pathway protein B